MNKYPDRMDEDRIRNIINYYEGQSEEEAVEEVISSLIQEYIAIDPTICHGSPTIRGTRILVTDILEQVASNMDWDEIIGEYNGLSYDSISASVLLAIRMIKDE